MKIDILLAEKDPMGTAMADFQSRGKANKLSVFSSMFEEDEIPVKHLFRSYSEMSSIEKLALQKAEGVILDVGAGSGCHSLALKDMKKKVHAIDISPLAVEVMKKRGVENARQVNFFDERFSGTYDTILFLMNGSGIIGKIEHLPLFFKKLKQILSPEGCVLMDSSDLRYLFEEEDGSYQIDLNAGYYGEVDFRMQYGKVEGERFDWLYIDYQTLSFYAAEFGFKTELLLEGEHYDYLAKISFI